MHQTQGIASPRITVPQRTVMLLLYLPSSLAIAHRSFTGVPQQCAVPHRSRVQMETPSIEDAESNARLVAALFNDVAEVQQAFEKSKDVSSHMQLDYDDDGKPLQLRFAYVDERECIGCTYCASIARNTFFMEPDAGRARVFAQGQDEPDVVIEAIDCCPVNCISFVDYEDLVMLEKDRDGVTIDQRSSGYVHGDSWALSRNNGAKPKNSASLMCCNNCPSRGCKECPMYGVGLNPVYLERMEATQAKRVASGAAQNERESTKRSDLVESIFSTPLPAPGNFVEQLEQLDNAEAQPADECIMESRIASELAECASPAAAEPEPELSEAEALELKLQALYAEPYAEPGLDDL